MKVNKYIKKQIDNKIKFNKNIYNIEIPGGGKIMKYLLERTFFLLLKNHPL
jgi:hypothetical protein